MNRGATWILQAGVDDTPIDLGLPEQVLLARFAVGIERQRNVEFGDVNLNAQCGEPRDIGSDRRGVEVRLRNVHLQSDSVDWYAAVLEVFHHRIDCVCLAVESLALRFVAVRVRTAGAEDS